MPEQAQSNSSVHIEYVRPASWKQILAHFIDFFIFVVTFLLMFLGLRGIASVTSAYKNATALMNEIQLDSGLYMEYNERPVDVVSYYDSNAESYTAKEITSVYEKTMSTFIAYVGSHSSVDNQKIVQDNYDQYRLNLKFSDGKNYFITHDDQVVYNLECTATYDDYNKNVYSPYISNQAKSYLSTLFPEYLEATRLISNTLLFVEVPVAVILAGILVYFVPPLIFARGRRTIGMLVYKIGRVGQDVYSLRLGRFIAESAIFIFGILALSLVTLGVPLIISFSMLIFSKKKQDFPDYMLGIETLDLTSSKIYFNRQEIEQEYFFTERKAVDFQMENGLDK